MCGELEGTYKQKKKLTKEAVICIFYAKSAECTLLDRTKCCDESYIKNMNLDVTNRI